MRRGCERRRRPRGAGPGPAAITTYEDAVAEAVLGRVKTICPWFRASPKDRASPSFFVDGNTYRQVGFKVHPVNPGAEDSGSWANRVRPAGRTLPGPVDMVDIFRNSEAAAETVDEVLALETPPKVIWMQLGVRNDAAARKAEAAGITVVMNRCPKQEWARLNGEFTWHGFNSRVISSKKRPLTTRR